MELINTMQSLSDFFLVITVTSAMIIYLQSFFDTMIIELSNFVILMLSNLKRKLNVFYFNSVNNQVKMSLSKKNCKNYVFT